MNYSRATRRTIQDGFALTGLWIVASWVSEQWLYSALGVMALGLVLSVRARTLLHAYADSRNEKLLPFLTGIEGDIAYRFQKSERDIAEEQGRLLERLEHIEAALAAVDRGFILLGENNYLRWWNPAAEKQLKLNPDKDLGRPLDNYLRDPAFEAIMGSVDQGHVVVGTSPSDDRRTLEISVFTQGQDGKVVIIRDITRIKQLEQTRSDFASNVSHELKTPITVIKGYAETLKDLVSEPAPLVKGIHQISHQADRMQDIVEDLLWLNRLENTRLADTAPLDLSSLLTSARNDALELAGALGRAPDIQIEVDGDWHLTGNHREISTAIRNLVVNAVRYCQQDVQVSIQWAVTDKGGQLSVADNGPGIPRRDLQRLTERFYRVDQGRSRDAGGTGLGLAIVKHVMDRHGGRLRIRSKVGSGSTFSCHFPMSAVKPVAQSPRPVEIGGPLAASRPPRL